MNRPMPSTPRALLLAVGGLLAMTGCRVGPDYRSPQPLVGATQPLDSLEPTAETTQPPPDAWWKLYNDSRLDALIDEALHANADLAAADANFASAAQILAAARGLRYPSTLIEAGGVRGRDATTDEILEFTSQEPKTIWLIEDVVKAAYEVDLFGRVRRTVEAAGASIEATAAARDSLKIVVVAETARAYAQVCAIGEEIAVARRSLDIVSHEAQITGYRHDAGANSEFDVVRADGLVAQTRSRIAPLVGQQRAALFQLTALLGRTPMHAPTDIATCDRPPELTALLPIGDGAALLKRRPDVRQAERSLAAATARIGVATGDLYPKISLSGLYGGVGLSLSDLGAERGLTWGIGPSLSWNFPNQSIPRARVKQAQASATAALASFDSAVLIALKETEQALAVYAAALENRQALIDARDKANRAFSMAHDQFLAGSLSNLDLLTTEQMLVAANAAVAASDSALVQDQIAVFKALGGGWTSAASTGVATRVAVPRTAATATTR